MSAKMRKKSDAILRRKASTSVQKPNPFETMVMKTKHAVLNRGTHSKRPGKLQSMSYEKRDQTLGKEFALMHKTNRFLDARTNNKYARGPSKKVQAKEMFNLNLTHGGRTMHEIERFDDVPDGADDDEDEDGMLQESFTNATHFGGGSDEEDPRRDRKTVIEEMIAESKRQKAERQRENDELYDMRQKLDDDLKSLMPQFNEHIRRDDERPQVDDFDRALREMVFEPRGAPTEKLKSIDVAATEQKRREALEREKQERMQSELNASKAKSSNRPVSADALSDEYLIDDVNGYDEDADEVNEQENEYGLVNGEREEDETDKESDDDADSSDVDSLSDLKAATQHNDSVEDSESEDEPEQDEKSAPKAKLPVQVTTDKVKYNCSESLPVPRIVDVPREYEQFVEMLSDKNVTDRIDQIASMIHTLKQKNFLNKSRWSVLFAYMLNYLSDRFTRKASIEDEFQVLHLLTPLLHDIAATDPSGIGNVYLSVVEEKYSDFKNHPRHYPDLATLVLLKLVPLLFSASDRRHSIVTPVLVFIGEMLTRCQVRNRRDISRGLFLVTTVLECVEHSQRFLPSAVAFLIGVLDQASPKGSLPAIVTITQPFKQKSCLLLADTDNDISGSEVLQLTAQDLLLTQITPVFKVRAIACTVSLVSALCKQLNSVAAVATLAKQFLQPLNIISKQSYPPPVQEVLRQTKNELNELSARSLAYLVQAEKKPKPLRLLEPKINPVYEDIRRRPKAAIPLREQRRKLQQKIKKVTRGAKREIRLDNEYISKLQHKKRMESDRERKQKVRQIFSYASSQQAELKSLDRRAKYRK
ncbi:nucleolar protein 14 homolog [Anopheles moucheti]|uniref:nucleolar protein 14 homolog n=1 Tax=Anopheles moucheti TaxID=186751 RepID=UPI0022F04077|nr:nucleolar protein 14 homolog [Anopheles moucheti]